MNPVSVWVSTIFMNEVYCLELADDIGANWSEIISSLGFPGLSIFTSWSLK